MTSRGWSRSSAVMLPRFECDRPPFSSMTVKLPTKAMCRCWARLSFCLLLAMVFYLTVKPNPGIQEVPWMPKQPAVYFDMHDGWKNIVGYGVLALAGFMGWRQGWGPRHWSGWLRRGVQTLSFCGIVLGMELLQLLIPTRFCDIKDVTAGSFGVAVAWLMAAIAERCLGPAMRGHVESQRV